MPRTRSQLTRADWLKAGQQLLRDEGFPAVKIARVTALLNVTTGSFYHHFADFPAYLDALADSYGADNPADALAIVADLEPRERMARLDTVALALDIPRLDLAMRIWAQSSPRAAAAVQRLDHAFLAFLEQTFLDLGFDADGARVRALVSFSAGAGRSVVYSPWTIGDDDRDRFLDMLCRPD